MPIFSPPQWRCCRRALPCSRSAGPRPLAPSPTRHGSPGKRSMPAPLYHSAPSVFAQFASQIAELFVLMPRFEAEETLALIERHRIDTVYLVPIMYVRLLKLPAATRARYDVSSLR